jgi:hypothetical protein
MTKEEAERETLKAWRALPVQKRQNLDDATEFAKLIAPGVPFDTLGSHDRIVEAWLHRDVQKFGRQADGLRDAKSVNSGR